MEYQANNKDQKDTIIGKGRIHKNPATGKPQVFKPKKCRSCGEGFTPVAPSHLYCSEQCRRDNWNDLYLQRTYGITSKDVKEMYDRQGGKCAICKGEGFKMHPKTKLNLVVDHCHKTGKVRGLLCHNCNRALGLLQDNEGSLKSAMEYVKGAETIT